MKWLQETVREVRRKPLPALIFALGTVTIAAILLSLFLTYRLIQGLDQEQDNRVQMACEMSFANGYALLDTVSEDVDPATVERYRSNLQRRANEVINRYDPEYECKIPEELPETSETSETSEETPTP